MGAAGAMARWIGHPRRFACLAACLLAIGCSSDDGTLCARPAASQALPSAHLETLARACGAPQRAVTPIAAASGNVWPLAPDHVPTMLDLQKQGAAAAPAEPARRFARGYGLCRAAAGSSAPPPGVALGVCFEQGK
jgi:hypothetical protein